MPSTSGDASDFTDYYRAFTSIVSMPSTSGDESDVQHRVLHLPNCPVSMPSTSGDASDRNTGKPVKLAGEFQCPQPRAMHLTWTSSPTTPRRFSFQCPQHRAMHLTLPLASPSSARLSTAVFALDCCSSHRETALACTDTRKPSLNWVKNDSRSTQPRICLMHTYI